MTPSSDLDDSRVFYRLLNLTAVVLSGYDSADWIRVLQVGNPETHKRETGPTAVQSRLLIPRTELQSLHELAPDQLLRTVELIKQFPDELVIVDTNEGEDRGAALERILNSLMTRGKLVQLLPTSIEVLGTPDTSRRDPSPSPQSQSQSSRIAKGGKKRQHQSWSPGRLIGRSDDVTNLRLLIDTSSLMSVGMEQFCDEDLTPWATVILNTEETAIITVPREVMRELETMAGLESPQDNPHRQEYAIAGIKHLSTLSQRGLLKLVSIGHANDKQAADDVFGPLILQLLLEYDVLLITQDRNLGALCNKQYEAMAASAAFTGRKHRFASCRLQNGRLVLHDNPTGPEPPPWPRRNTPELRQLDRTPVPATPYPKEHGDEVITEDGQHFQICHPGMAGGEGVVYLVDGSSEDVAKIYHPDHLQKWRFEKLRLMVANQVSNRAVAWPSCLLSNSSGQPVGFLMPRIDDAVPLVDSTFSTALLADRFPHWRRRDLVILARNLASVVSILHRRSEVIGDLNPANILVHESDGEPRVKLVDCDSWQFEGFPSPVGMLEYTHPDLSGKNFNNFLRSQEHDLFALPVLIFQILFVGRHPFSNKGEQTLAEAMKARAFSYPLGRNDNEDRDKTPKGFPFKVWTHLPWPIQEAFYNVFSLGQSVTAAEWSRKLHKYYLDIDNDRLDTLDNADRIKPSAVRVPKRRAGDVSEVLHCQESGCSNTEEYFGAEVIARKKEIRFFRCRKCQDSNRLKNEQGASRLCQKCATVFSHPIWFEEMLESNGHTMQELCSKHGGPRSEFQCIDCGWKWNERSIEHWKTVNSIPEPRCVKCRGKRRDEVTLFQCARCSTTFRASNTVAQILSAKPAKWVLCFDCNNQARGSAPLAATPAKEKQQQKSTATAHSSARVTTPQKSKSFLGRIWDTLTGP